MTYLLIKLAAKASMRTYAYRILTDMRTPQGKEESSGPMSKRYIKRLDVIGVETPEK